MAVESPSPGRIGADQIAYALTRLDDDGVFIGRNSPCPFSSSSQAVQMNRMFHHRVVDEDEAQPLAKFQVYRFGLVELVGVKAPDEALHVSRKV